MNPIIKYLFFCISLSCSVLFLSSHCSDIDQSFDGIEETINRDAQWVEYVKSKYQHFLYGLDCIFYPAKNPKRLIVSFSYTGSFYGMWSWFWEKDENWNETAFLFLRDLSGTWYSGSANQSLIDNFSNVIKHFVNISGLSYDKVFTLGISTGGYAAILYGALLGCKGALADIPQFNAEIWQKNTGNFNPLAAWHDIAKVLRQTAQLPIISIHHGSFLADAQAASEFINVLKERVSTFIIRRTAMTVHWGGTLKKSFILKEFEYMENQETLVPLV